MKTFLIICFFTSSLLSQEFSIRYDVNVGMFGKVGYADIDLREEDDEYEVDLSAVIVGVAATLTGNRVETFKSSGKIVDGKYIPDTFTKTKTTTTRNRIQTYTFDHEKREVKLVQEKTKEVSRSHFDTTNFNIYYEDVNETSIEKSTLDNYMAHDALTSFLNTRANSNKDNKHYNLVAVGAHNDENRVTVSYLDGEEKELAKLNFSSDIKDIYNLHVEPTDEDENIVDVLVAYDSNGIMKEALLGEVFWIGKITANRVDKNSTDYKITIK